MRRLLAPFFASAFVALSSVLPVTTNANDGSVVGQLTTTCSVQEATGTHDAAASNYTVNGQCLFYENGRLFEAQAVNWTAKGSHQPNTKATFEMMTLRYVESGQERYSGSMSSTMQCGSDPWRLPPSAPCRFVVRNPGQMAGHVSIAYQELVKKAPTFPLSVFLSPAHRAGLQRQYDIAMAKYQKFDRSMSPVFKPRLSPSGPVSSSDPVLQAKAIQNYPTILLPTGDVVAQGELYVQIQEPKVGTTPVTEIEWTWLDAPSKQPYVNTFADDTKKLRNRTKVDVAVTRGQFGRWQVRARMSGQATPGPWSPPTFFTLVATQSMQSLKMPPPNPATPFSPNEPISIDGQSKRSNSGTGTFRPQTTPQQGLGAGPTLIRPRGVEEKEPGNEMPQPKEPAKTP